MAENPRIEELRRRVQKDPASIAFAQLAEEYRRAGHYEDAIDICRTGLQTHPSYLSARVTLGRALIETNDLENAEAELRYVLLHAAENLAAIRAMAEIHQRRGELTEALGFYKSALELARHDPDLEQTVDEISRTIAKAPAPAPAPVTLPEPAPALTPEQRSAEFLAKTFDLLDLEDLDLVSAPAVPTAAVPPAAAPKPMEPAFVAAALPEPEAQAQPEVQPEPELPVYAAPENDLSQLEDFLNQLPVAAPKPIAAEPAEHIAAAPLPAEPEPEEDLPQEAHAASIDDLALLESFLNQEVPEVDLGAALDAAPVSLGEYPGIPAVAEPVLPEPVVAAARPEPEPELVTPSAPAADDLVLPRAAWGVGAPQASGKEWGEGPPRLIMNPALLGLERFLEAIHKYRQQRAV